MNKTSLSALYRRLTLKGPALQLDADDVVAAADGTLNADRREQVAQALAASPLHADVAHMLRDLKADSQALAADVARTQQREMGHRRHQHTDRRVAAGRRFGGVARWATALAACLVAVVGVWTQRHPQTAPRSAPVSHVVARADVIFSTRDVIFDGGMDNAKHKVRREDHLFRANFSDG